MFSVRIVSIDSYQAIPISDLDPTFSEFRGREIKRVPVIRIFGITSVGKKACLHIHGVFPYMYIPCTLEDSKDTLLHQLSATIDNAINMSLGNENYNTQHVYKIQLVRGIPFYGYHESQHLFFKIYFYNPAMVRKTADLLQNIKIFNKKLQPHEAHIPFILQFMIDYNLYGMNFINVNNTKFRWHSSNEEAQNSSSFELYDTQKYLPISISKQTQCEIEIDVQAINILNREAIEKGLDLNPGLSEIWNAEKMRRAQGELEELQSQLSGLRSIGKRVVSPTLNDKFQEQRLLERLKIIAENAYNVRPNLDETSYPLPVQNDSVLNASYLVNHLALVTDDKECLNNTYMDRNVEQLPSQETALNEEITFNNSTTLNVEDLCLVDMLANLPENEESHQIIDDNSILSSQYSEVDEKMACESDTEENELLNLTSLDLTSFSPWEWSMNIDNQLNSTAKNSDIPEQANRMSKTEAEEKVKLIYPQLDGANDLPKSPKPEKKKPSGTHSTQNSNTPTSKEKMEAKRTKLVNTNELEILQSPQNPTRSYSRLKLIVTSQRSHKANRSSQLNLRDQVQKGMQKINLPEGSSDPNSRNCIFSRFNELRNRSRSEDPYNYIEIDDEKEPQKQNIFISQSHNLVPKKLRFSDSSVEQVTANKNEVIDCNPNLETSTKTSHSLTISEYRTADENLLVNNITNNQSQISQSNIFESEGELEACNTTFTQYIEERMKTQHQNFSLHRECTSKRQKEIVTIITKFNPPPREHLMDRLKLCNLLTNYDRNKPFFGNKLDLMKEKNTWSNVCRTLPFVSSLQGITGIKLWRRMKMNEFYPSGGNIKTSCMKRVLSDCKFVTIRTLYEPPQPNSVKKKLKRKEIDGTKQSDNTAKEEPNLLPKLQNMDTRESSFHTATSSGEISLLYNNKKASIHLGVSHGQIEYSFKETSDGAFIENLYNARKSVSVHQYLTLLSLEVHILTRADLTPDPKEDPVEGIFYAIQNDIPVSSDKKQMEYGAIIVNSCSNQENWRMRVYSSSMDCPIQYVKSEEELFKSLVSLMYLYDPDILLGWEAETLSWGYVLQRAFYKGLTSFSLQISRTPNAATTNNFQASSEENPTEVRIPGRILLNVWRIMRHEAALLNYTFENVIYHVMKERIPCHSFKTLSDWWRHPHMGIQSRIIEYYITRVIGTIRVLSHLDIIGRTSEYARLFGIQFYEVFSRGSQFRVESMMLRLAKPLNYIPVSPSVQQRARMRAPAALPLIMEPESKFYTDPVIVLDFQSLYPSIMIAYNYCFSTCLGRVEHIGLQEPFEFGATSLKVDKETISRLIGKINYSPCGVAYVKSEVRQGILPRMLTEILGTRLMVKNSMKLHSAENKSLQRILDSQQLGLKLIANVTYGYTSANFSGRMPCIEVGDSVVSKGRETLERAIKLVENTPQWGARVIYGDTDSIFILLLGKSKEEAFVIGAEIADAVTAANPPPVKLKFEKVFYPCILQTKKRYCGYMYESINQKNPEYLAKGIETVRRDGCPAVSKILEKTLKILFDTKDLSQVKNYVIRQFDKIFRQTVSIQDLTFAKEFRGINGYKANSYVPALELTRRFVKNDPRAIPRTGERVRYVIVAGAPNQPLIQCVRTPWEVMTNWNLYPNSIYYITKVIIPPLNRCLNLIGIDVNTWYQEMSRRRIQREIQNTDTKSCKLTIRQFLSATICNVCEEQSNGKICKKCMAQPDQTLVTLYEKIRCLQRTYWQVNEICHSCVGRADDPKCASLDCPVLYRMNQVHQSLSQIDHINCLINNKNVTVETDAF